MKQNLIVKVLESYSNFASNISETRIKNKSKKDKRNLDKIKDDVEYKDEREKARKKELQIALDQSVSKKAFTYKMISTVATITSMFLSSMGITHAKTLNNIKNNAQNIALVAMIVFICFTIWQISFNIGYIKERFNNHNATLKILQVLVITLSITSNYKFLVEVIKPVSTFDYLYIGCFAFSFDIISLKFSALSEDCKYMNYSYADDLKENTSFLKMLVFVATYKLKMKLKSKYLKGLDEYKTTFQIAQDNTQETEQDNKVIETTTLQTDVKSNVTTFKPAVHTNDKEYKKIKHLIFKLDDNAPVTNKILNISYDKYKKIKPLLIEDGLVYVGNQNRIFKQSILKQMEG